MKPRHSPIFEAYEKIALEQGLISEAAEEDKKSITEQREWSNAGILYGLKNEKSLEELLENAHPETIVMGPAYDAMQGVVENLSQQNSIMTQIALKSPRGLHIFNRYVKASEDLMLETIKLATYLDNKDQEQLAIIADSCNDSLKKEAAIFMAILPYLAAGAGLLSFLGSASHNNPISQGFKNDLLRTDSELNDVKESYPQIASALSPFQSLLKKIVELINSLDKETIHISTLITQIGSETDKELRLKLLGQVSSNIFKSGKDKAIKSIVEKIKESCVALLETAADIRKIISSAPERFDTPSSAAWQWIMKIKDMVVQSDVEDALDLIEVLVRSCTAYMKDLDSKLVVLDQLKVQVDAVQNITADQSAKPDEQKQSKSKLPSWA